MNKNIRKICLALCGAAVFGVGSAAIINVHKANAGTELIIPQEYVFETEYDYGDILIVPEPSLVCVKTGGVETAAVGVELVFPDGAVKSEGSYTLDKTGTYSLTYYNAGGASVKKTIVVHKNNYSVEEGASASYSGKLFNTAGLEGVEVSLKDGASFSFNKTINLNDYAGQTLDVCTMYPMFREDSNDSPAATTVSVKVVDCYDSSKFVEMYVWCGTGGQNIYTGAGASTQVLTGLEYNTSRPQIMTEDYEGTKYKIHRPSRYQSLSTWGAAVRSKSNADVLYYGGITLSWDLSNHKIRVKNGPSSTLITDLDSTEIYDVSALDFASFFTTGDVYLNVEAYNYSTPQISVGLTEIFGMSGEVLQNNRIVDEEKPEVFVDVTPTEGNRIYLQKDKPVRLPSISKVLDFNYYGNERVEVYRNYGKRGQALVGFSQGLFTPTSVGNYTAVYTATDSYGNEGKYLLEMVVVEEESLSYAEKALDKLVAAKDNVLPALNVTGLNKEVATAVVVTAPDGKEKTVEYNGEDGYTFVPEYAGTYSVSYIFKDNVYEEEYTYDVVCVDENSAAFQNPFNFSSYFMKGASYVIDPVIAYTAGQGKFKENAATLSVSSDGGAYQTLSASQMAAYKVEASNTLRFKASYGESFVESPVYTVIDVGYGKTTTEKNYLAYMQGNYVDATIGADGAVYSFDGDASLQFINKISSDNFKLNFNLQATAVESFSVILRDVANPSRTYVEYTYQQDASLNIVMHAKQYEDGALVLDKKLLTKYRELNGAYVLAYSSLGLRSDDVLMEGVKAFAKDYALLEICVNGATGGCSLAISRVNAQTFTATMRESKPQMAFQECNGALEINSKYSISPCYASSALSVVLSKDIKVTVTAPDGEIVTSTDGVKLENVTADKLYEITLSQAGQYRVTYAVSCIGATKSNGQEVLKDDDYYIINVSEGIAPVIKFKDGANSQTTVNLSVGSSHNVKDFEVTDNVTAQENLRVIVMILDDGFTLEENGYNVDSYVFKNKGKFIVYVVAYDELGNSSSAYYNVVVS